MIHSGNPLRHPVIIGVFGLERELKDVAQSSGGQLIAVPCQPSVGSHPLQRLAPVTNQAKPYIVALAPGVWRAEDGAHELVIEVWRPGVQLRLLQRVKSVVMPRRLTKDREGKRVPVKKSGRGDL